MFGFNYAFYTYDNTEHVPSWFKNEHYENCENGSKLKKLLRFIF